MACNYLCNVFCLNLENQNKISSFRLVYAVRSLYVYRDMQLFNSDCVSLSFPFTTISISILNRNIRKLGNYNFHILCI